MEAELSRLSQHSGLPQTSDAFKLHILQHYIRPKFSAATPPTVTPAGRAAINVVSRPAHELVNQQDQAWRVGVVAEVFAWVIEGADAALIHTNWHLIIPPLLTLLDSPTTRLRLSGLRTLSRLLPNLTPKILQQTGIGAVLEAAVLPTLLFLPSLTPVEESLFLLDPAYDVLVSLAEVRFPGDGTLDRKARLGALDRVIREGVWRALSNSREDVGIVGLVIGKMGGLVAAMGIHAVKHLKEMIPYLVTTLTNPFGPAHPPLLATALATLHTVLMNCWPRISEPIHFMSIVRASSVCWRHIAEELQKPQLDLDRRTQLVRLKPQVALIGRTLMHCSRDTDTAQEMLEPLFGIDYSLKEVFVDGDRVDIACGQVVA